jgi:hypothetical protein
VINFLPAIDQEGASRKERSEGHEFALVPCRHADCRDYGHLLGVVSGVVWPRWERGDGGVVKVVVSQAGMPVENVTDRRAEAPKCEGRRVAVLCWNCNCGRYLNGGVCPHKARECS